MSLGAWLLPAPLAGHHEAPRNGLALSLDPVVPRRLLGAYLVEDTVAGAPRPAARALVITMIAGPAVTTELPFRDAVFYADDEGGSAELRWGYFAVDVPADRAPCVVYAFLGLASSNGVEVR
jgi:hypothetical protein